VYIPVISFLWLIVATDSTDIRYSDIEVEVLASRFIILCCMQWWLVTAVFTEFVDKT
jgi:hypothetical protein